MLTIALVTLLCPLTQFFDYPSKIRRAPTPRDIFLIDSGECALRYPESPCFVIIFRTKADGRMVLCGPKVEFNTQ